MDAVFLKILNMSIAAGWLIVAVMILRLFLKRAPKWINCLLWAVVAVRLAFPFSIESVLSLIPSAETLPEKVISGPSFDINSGITVVDSTVNGYLDDKYFEGVTVPTGNGSNVMGTLGVVWLAGVALMLVYAIVSYVGVRHRVREAVAYEGNIMLCDRISTPFILGVLFPKIYLPTVMNEGDMALVLSHEKAHLKRKDHIWKPLGFVLLAVYWFNPLVWIAYILLCRDIELACDERVIKGLGEENKKSYSTALLNCSVSRPVISACPLAFGEVSVKKRIKSVLNYKKSAFWVVIVALIACVLLAVCFLTNPKSFSEKDLSISSKANITGMYIVNQITYTDDGMFTADEDGIMPHYFIDNNVLTWSVVGEPETNENNMTDIGALTPIKLDKGNFDSYFKKQGNWSEKLSPETIRKNNKRAWSTVCKWNYGLFFYLLEQENGDFYICRGFSEGERTIRAIQKLTAEQGFCATVLEVNKAADGKTDVSILVEPFEGEQVRNSGDKISVMTGLLAFKTPDFKVGDEVWIDWSGGIQEIYPPQLVSVNGIFKLRDSAKKAEENGTPAFNATVVEMYETSVFVKPFEGEPIGEGLISVGISDMQQSDRKRLQVGTKVRIEYDGTLLYTYPAQLGRKYAIYILEE